ncbi:Ribonuclease HII [uncultured Desulfobacterium sp.]|uniref:Ribonuclease HII n=1 Tax=uncultured Desulfobacterium sp. TaxID=201089 RepID=A0A445MXP2_9BACT|nr:Ribonuclease HII [uncultured Desulfobacterium sp.]
MGLDSCAFDNLLPTPPKNLSLFPESEFSAVNEPFYFEDLARKNGYSFIAGVDEAGRGPLAGPVVASAVILSPGVMLEGIRDSKQMSSEARDQAFTSIHREALTSGIGVVSHRYIDEFNILNASLEAMRQAVLALDPQPDFILVDGIHRVPVPVPQWCIKKGDSLSRSISAASVLAKVYRDRIMASYHQMYPVYGFDRHKGYGTARHLKALNQYGPCPVHRMSFKGVV